MVRKRHLNRNRMIRSKREENNIDTFSEFNAALLAQNMSFHVLFEKNHRHIYVDVFAVLVLMPQFIKRPISFFLFAVEYRPFVLCL